MSMYGFQPGFGMAPQYSNPYFDRLAQMQPQPQQAPVQVTRVSGKNGADAFIIPPNSSVLLLDETAPIVWLKTTDGAGYPTCTPYQITPYNQPEPQPTGYDDLEARIQKLEERLNGKSNAQDARTAKSNGGK